MSILPKQVRWKDHLPMKLWAWDKKNLPSITHAIRTAVAATVSVVIARLVQMPEAYWAAIATLVIMQSTLGATLTTVDRANRRHGRGRLSWSARDKLLRSKSGRVRGCDLSRRIAVDRVSFGEDRISLRERYPHYHRSNSARRLHRGASLCTDSSKSQSESSLLSPSSRCGRNINQVR